MNELNGFLERELGDPWPPPVYNWPKHPSTSKWASTVGQGKHSRAVTVEGWVLLSLDKEWNTHRHKPDRERHSVCMESRAEQKDFQRDVGEQLQSLSCAEYVNSGVLIHNIVTIVCSRVFSLKFAKRINLMGSHQKQRVTVWSEGRVDDSGGDSMYTFQMHLAFVPFSCERYFNTPVRKHLQLSPNSSQWNEVWCKC